MIYTMNGMTTHLNLRADIAGEYRGLSAHLSGDGFSDMHFEARAVSAEDFAKWAQGAGGQPFDEAAYRELEKQGLAQPDVHPLAAATLFDDIVSQKIPPAPGPTPDVRPTPGG
jgi:cytochrome o ubiquinol oxidase subunit 2